MKAQSISLTKEERDVVIVASRPLGSKHPNNTEIGQCLGLSVSKVKILIYQACIKLGARNRIEAKLLALRRGEIKLNEIYSFDDMVEFLLTLRLDLLKRIVIYLREGLMYEHPSVRNDRIIHTDRWQDTILTKSERDILILVGRGLANREIADTLYLSIDTVEKFLCRAYTKLEVTKRSDAVFLAAERGEIGLSEMFSFSELLEFLIPLEAEAINKMSQMLDKKLVQARTNW